MTVHDHSHGSKPAAHPALRSFSPDDPTPSKSAARRDVSPWLNAAAAYRMRYRVRIVSRDRSTPSGRRVNIVEFSHPGRILDLLRRLRETPEEEFTSITLEATARPKWEPVPLEFVRWRAAQRARRDAERDADRAPGGAR